MSNSFGSLIMERNSVSQLKIYAISRHEGLKVIFPLLRRIHSLSSFPRKAIILFNAISRVRGNERARDVKAV